MWMRADRVAFVAGCILAACGFLTYFLTGG